MFEWKVEKAEVIAEYPEDKPFARRLLVGFAGPDPLHVVVGGWFSNQEIGNAPGNIMTLTPGARLGPYEIVAPIGAGGMGEVYRATDSKLGRDVAIKVLPAGFARDPERLARFEREARALASLNHPNIAAIYGLEHVDGAPFLVLELVEGETLAGPVAVEEALRLSMQIAEALEAAHEKGIVHRDLKPANIKVTPEGKVKVLDFGLARLAIPDSDETVEATQAGTVLGTAPYMSPEQARGRRVDKRADIWAFGCVLYELLAGRRAFGGETVAESLAAVLGREPEWSLLPARTPPEMKRLLELCLEKEPKQRLQDIGDARIVLEENRPVTPSLPSPRRFLPWVLAAAALAVAAGSWWRPRAPEPRGVTRLAVSLPSGDRLQLGAMPGLALSPDGTRLVYAASRQGLSQLYLRRLNGFDATPLAGTEGGTGPFFSPDGEWLGFFAGGKLKKVALGGGAPVVLCEAPDGRGAAWAPDDTIAFTMGFSAGAGLSQVGAGGGGPRALTTPDAKQGEVGHRWPEMLPGGRALLFTNWTGGGFDAARIGLVTLGSGEKRMVAEGGSSPHYAAAFPEAPGKGYVVFGRAGNLLAAPLDLEGPRTTGPPFQVLDEVRMNQRTGAGHWSLAANGTLAYVPGGGAEADLGMVWVRRQGAVQAASQTRRVYDAPRLSPDGRRAAVVVVEGGTRNIWIHDLARDTLTRLTFEAAVEACPLWSPDGKRITYATNLAGKGNLFAKPADGSAPEERLLSSVTTPFATSWSPDGKWLAYEEMDPVKGADLWMLPMEGERKPRPFLATPYSERGARFSPNGKWLAYFSNESGRFQVYVQPFPGPGGKWQVSAGGGVEPIWSRDGRELFYRDGDKILAVEVRADGGFETGKPRVVLEGPYEFGPAFTNWDVAPDGRLLLLKGSEPAGPAVIHVVLNWFEELRAAGRRQRSK